MHLAGVVFAKWSVLPFFIGNITLAAAQDDVIAELTCPEMGPQTGPDRCCLPVRIDESKGRIGMARFPSML